MHSFTSEYSDSTCGAGTACPSGASKFNPGFKWGHASPFYAFCEVLCGLFLVHVFITLFLW